MKVQINIDGELWAKFRAKVHQADKTLSEVVPTVVEPALRAYVEPPYINRCDKCGNEIKDVEFLSGDGMAKLCLSCMPKATELPAELTAFKDSMSALIAKVKTPLPEKPLAEAIVEAFKPSPPVTIRRCELCDMPTERLFASGAYKVCYSCWKGALTAPIPPQAA